MILIIVPIFLFVSVLIDFARIQAADRESELAVKAGVRSVMSAFDKKLQTYGLYGQSYDNEHRRELFARAFASSLSGASDGSQYLDTKPLPQAAAITPMLSLADPEAFRRQVLEEMKYRTPIEYALEIADKFKQTGIVGKFQQGRAFAEQAEMLERLLDRRERALDDAWEDWQRLYDKMKNDRSFYETRLKELNGLAHQIGLNTIDGVRQSLKQIGEQMDSMQRSLAELDGSLASMAQAAQQSEESVRSIVSAKEALQRQLSELAAKRIELERLLQLLLQYAELVASTMLETKAEQTRVSELQTSIQDKLNEAKHVNDELRVEWTRLGTAAGQQEQFGNVRVLPDEHFGSFQADVASVTALFGAFAGQIASTLNFADEAYEQLKSKNKGYEERANAVYGNRESAEELRKERNGNVTSAKRRSLSTISDVLDQTKQAIGGCDTGSPTEPDRNAYKRLQQLEEKYSSDAAAASTTPEAGEAVTELTDARGIGTRAMRLVGVFSDAIIVVRDGAFINEFALTKLNYRTFGLKADGSGPSAAAPSLSQPEKHVLRNQEAEYVTYGFHSCAANIASAYGDMFAIRLAVRTIEQLTEPSNEALQFGSPLLVLLAAVAQGAGSALLDMNKFIQGEEVPLSDKFASSVRLTYRDYLRAQMLLRAFASRKLTRMQSLIELNTGVDLYKAATELQAGADTTVKLWFLPGAMKLLGSAGMSPCRTEGGRCILSRSAAWGY